jgi:uncharacterized membrane protein YeaQ/YmgE (transglycosylase-associated protein family)
MLPPKRNALEREGKTMSFLTFLAFVVIAAICGSVSQALIGYPNSSCLMATGIGLLGAYLGSWLANAYALPQWLVIAVGEETFSLVWALVGAAILTCFGMLLSRRHVASTT